MLVRRRYARDHEALTQLVRLCDELPAELKGKDQLETTEQKKDFKRSKVYIYIYIHPDQWMTHYITH